MRPLKPGIVLINLSSVTVFRLSLAVVVAAVASGAALVAAVVGAAVASGAALVAAGTTAVASGAALVAAAAGAVVAAGAPPCVGIPALVAAPADGCVPAGVVEAPQAARITAVTAAIPSIWMLRVMVSIPIKSFLSPSSHYIRQA
jgi:hypothetical protein